MTKIILRIFLPDFTVSGTENILKEEQAVFICNHSKKTGPTAMILHFSIPFRPWVIHDLFTFKTCVDYLEKDFVPNDLKLKGILGRIASYILAVSCILLSRSTESIPVYRNDSRALRTFEESISGLVRGDNIVIFPERLTPQYSEYVKEFYDGFVHLAKKMYRETGICLKFYPVYIDRDKLRIIVGDPEVFDAKTEYVKEKNRLIIALDESITKLAIESHKEKD
jgi:hypothetical protein